MKWFYSVKLAKQMHRWNGFKDGQEIKPSKNAVIKADGKKRMLILKKALKSDIGQYTCDCGTDKTSGKLDIEGKEISTSFTLEAVGVISARG